MPSSRDFVQRCDEEIIRLCCNTQVRLSEVGKRALADLDMDTDSVQGNGKGNEDRSDRFGPKTAAR